MVSVNLPAGTGLPQAADAVMGVLAPRPCGPTELPTDVKVRALDLGDWTAVGRIYQEGISTNDATFETEVPPRKALEAKWLPDHRWAQFINDNVDAIAAHDFGELWLLHLPLERERPKRNVFEEYQERAVGRLEALRTASEKNMAGICMAIETVWRMGNQTFWCRTSAPASIGLRKSFLCCVSCAG